MARSVAFQMDPIDGVDINADSSFVLALEAQARGFDVFVYGPKELSYIDGQVIAAARPVSLRRKTGDHVTFGKTQRLDLSALDVVMMRQDPPFDLSYISATHLLERIHPKTLVVNDPASVRNAPEKLFVTLFPELMPPTLITYSMAAIKEFYREHQDIIVKPLYGNGGAGVFHIKPGDDNLASLIELFERFLNEPLMVQRYIPEVRHGDKRIILVNGEPVGAINRVPPPDDARANMHAGGRAEAAGLSARDKAICATIGPALRDQGQIFVGIDVIGEYLTEINVTSPTGLQEIARFDGSDPAGQIWDVVEQKLAG